MQGIFFWMEVPSLMMIIFDLPRFRLLSAWPRFRVRRLVSLGIQLAMLIKCNLVKMNRKRMEIHSKRVEINSEIVEIYSKLVEVSTK